LLDLKGLEEVNNYSASSLLVVEFISVERRRYGFSLPSTFIGDLLASCSLFRLQLPFECINFFREGMKCQRLLSRSSFGFKASLVLFLMFKFGNCSAISRVMVVLVTIVTPHVRLFMILRRLAYTNGNRFLIILLSTGSEEGLRPLVRLIFSKFSKRLK
jgi:hypothetical protein